MRADSQTNFRKLTKNSVKKFSGKFQIPKKTWRDIIGCAHALRLAVGLHCIQKSHPIVKYKHYQISSGA